MKTLIGQENFASLRQVFFEIKDGKLITKYNYKFQVKPKKIVSAVTYINSTLQVRLGQCRSIRLGGHVFFNPTIYARSGKNFRKLHAAYTTSFKTTIRLKKSKMLSNF